MPKIDYCLLSYGTAYRIFRKCLERADISVDEHNKVEDYGWNTLTDKIKIAFENDITANKTGVIINEPFDWKKYPKFLRDWFGYITRGISKGKTHDKRRFQVDRVSLLLYYAGVNNPVFYDEEYNPRTLAKAGIDTPAEIPVDIVPVVFTATPFSVFDIYRIPADSGQLKFYSNGRVEFDGKTRHIIIHEHNLKQAIEYYMKFDRETFWIKIEYDAGNGTETAYFTETTSPGSTLKLLSPKNLLEKLTPLLSVATQLEKK